MTVDELHDAIIADPTAKALADAGNDAGCAAQMAAILPPVVSSVYLNERGVFAVFADPTDAEAVMAALEAAAAGDPAAVPPIPPNPVLKRALTWLQPQNGGIDLGHPGVRAMLDQMAAAGQIQPAAVATLKAQAERPPVVLAGDVSRAMRADRTSKGIN